MKPLYKFLLPLVTIAFAINVVSTGMTIVLLAMGINTIAWVFWYTALFSGIAILLATVTASIDYLLILGFGGYKRLMKSIHDYQHSTGYHIRHV